MNEVMVNLFSAFAEQMAMRISLTEARLARIEDTLKLDVFEIESVGPDERKIIIDRKEEIRQSLIKELMDALSVLAQTKQDS